MKYTKAVLIWLLIIPTIIINAILRRFITEPLFGDNFALPLSNIILSFLVFYIAYFFIPKLGKGKVSEFISIGIIWLALISFFDLIINLSNNLFISEFFYAHDITHGNLWFIVLVICFLAPLLVAKWKNLIIIEQNKRFK
ncbi:MAG: hypothetical protein FWE36_04410 [Erysipelotrichales bacterium]|nr:hypothetical protein [Erysipelotrichales bacterium]